MSEKFLTERAAEKRREYKRAWNAKNREKCKEHTRRYWERKVLCEQVLSDYLFAGNNQTEQPQSKNTERSSVRRLN